PVIFADGHARGMESAPQDQALLPRRIDHAMNRRCLAARRPAFRRGQTFAPWQAALRAALEDNRAPAMPLGIDADNGPAGLEQDGGRVAEVLTRLAVHNHLAMRLRG